MNLAVITVEQSDTYLSRYSDWLGLTAKVKSNHIRKASVYAQTQYTCDNVVWEDDPDTVEVEAVDIPDEILEAVAYYAYADFKENLFGDIAADEEEYHGNLRATVDKVGSLMTEKSYYKGGSAVPQGTKRILGYPDSLMAVHCTSSIYDTKLERV